MCLWVLRTGAEQKISTAPGGRASYRQLSKRHKSHVCSRSPPACSIFACFLGSVAYHCFQAHHHCHDRLLKLDVRARGWEAMAAGERCGGLCCADGASVHCAAVGSAVIAV